MENNKITINVSTIIILVVIMAFLLGFVCFGIYNNFSKSNAPVNSGNQYSEDQSNQEESNHLLTNNTITNNSNDDNTTNNNVTNSDTSGPSDLPSTSNSNSVEAKTSSKTNPVPIGEWSIASKYSSGEYVDVPVKVTNVTRGTSAAQEVKNYCKNGSSIYKYEDAKQGMEWAVVEYSVDLTKMEKDSSITLDRKITGTGDNTSIKYKDVTYIVTTMNMSSGYTRGEIVSCKFAVQLPIGCTDYLIALGSSSSTQAFFIGE